MPRLQLLYVLFLTQLHIPQPQASYAAPADRDTISPGQTFHGGDTLVSSTGKYALGFFQTGSKSSTKNSSIHWYLGIWINRVPTITPVWVANGDHPIGDLTTVVLTISPDDGNLVVLNSLTKSIIWSTRTNIKKTNTTFATLTDGGNFVLHDSLNPSAGVLWQSFDHPTNCLLPGAKIGRDKVTGLNLRLVSRKNSIDQAPGAYSLELDPTGASQFVLVELNSGVPYWSSGEWNGRFFDSIPDMGAYSQFVNNSSTAYLTTPLQNGTMIVHLILEVSGQVKSSIWYEQQQSWIITASQPKSQCDVHAVCGPFTICNDNNIPCCSCMKGFSIRSLEDWELEDRSGGCVRNAPLDIVGRNRTTGSTDGFYSIPCSRLPQNAHQSKAVVAKEDECAHVCLRNSSCTAYSFGYNGCYVWHGELLNVKQQQHDDLTTGKVEFLKVRLAAKEVKILKGRKRRLIWAVSGASVGLSGLLLVLMIWCYQKKRSGPILKSNQGGNGIVAFRYNDLQRATKNFSTKLGNGGFGAVYKGVLADSITIAVKVLGGFHQGEKQFKAEVSSIGTIHHVNLVQLIGFCCEGERRLLVYEYVANRSLDALLFQSNATFLHWRNRYQIALGVARGLAYLHEECRECIIHCDIKPQNILLDSLLVPKIADFGMAKFLPRDFSRVVTTMRGTVGYLAPEWLNGVAVTAKLDVYSYGMVLLEIVSGRRNSSGGCTSCGHNDDYFPLQVANNLQNGDVQSLFDHKLCGDVNIEEVERACKVACWCIQDLDSDRPTMGEVVQMLEGLRYVTAPPIPKILQAVAGSST